MKKLVLSFMLLSFSAFSTVKAQTPEKKNVALFSKITATWCPNCGAWGWDLAEQMSTSPHLTGEFLYLGLFASTNNATFNNLEFASTFAATIAENFGFSGYPTFHVNGVGESTSGVVLGKAINDFSATPVIVSAASISAIDGNKVTVTTNMKFWEAASGEYFLNAYLVEDGAMNYQNERGSGLVAHKGVFRAPMAPYVWGERMTNGAVTAGQTYSHTFTYTITNQKWDKSKLKVYTLIWKRDGLKYDYVNGSATGSSTTSVERITAVQDVVVYPNPASGMVTVSFSSLKAAALKIGVTDMLGRSVYASKDIQATAGNNTYTIPVSNLNAGVYHMTIYSDGGNITKSFSVTK